MGIDGRSESFTGASRTLTVLVHGIEGSRLDWLERGGYTKGGDLTDRLSRLGMSWVACDLYGHGDWPAEEAGFSREDISDDLYPVFLRRSSEAIRQAIATATTQAAVDRLNVVSYSAGCDVAVDVLKTSVGIPVVSFLMAAPVPHREFDDEYSLHNNLEVFAGRTVGVFCGRQDEYVSFEEISWFFDQLPDASRHRWDYSSGHALPVAWVDDAVALLQRCDEGRSPTT
ncbi:MAG: hypothetical protein GXX79_08205 [Actinomycetales bacterium]|nr:hypothetical protein [Actinomycetales bacterium]